MTEPQAIQERLKRDISAIGKAVGRFAEAVAGLNAAVGGLQAEGVTLAMQALIEALQAEYASHLPTFYAALGEHLAAFEELRQACAEANMHSVLEQGAEIVVPRSLMH